jgi:hypothetical protein
VAWIPVTEIVLHDAKVGALVSEVVARIPEHVRVDVADAGAAANLAACRDVGGMRRAGDGFEPGR